LTYYRLADDGITPVAAYDALAWARWFESVDRHIAEDRYAQGDGTDVRVSTVFLGLNHNWGDGPPILWETLVFNGPLDGEMNRYNSHAAAVKGHHAMCIRVRAAIDEY
jgi:hypothetical protein